MVFWEESRWFLVNFRRKVGDFDGFEEEMRWFLVVFGAD